MLQNILSLAGSNEPVIIFIFFLIVVCLVTTLLVSFERFYLFRRLHMDLPSFLQGIFNVLKNNKKIEAVSTCDKMKRPVAEVIRAMILADSQDETTIRNAAADVGEIELNRLENGLWILSIIVFVAPMLSILGIVSAFAMAFSGMDANTTRLPFTVLKDHLETACLMAASGMTVSIIAYLSYHYFLIKLNSIRLNIEKAAIEMNYFLTNKFNNESSNSKKN